VKQNIQNMKKKKSDREDPQICSFSRKYLDRGKQKEVGSRRILRDSHVSLKTNQTTRSILAGCSRITGPHLQYRKQEPPDICHYLH